jgi:hypothetical protein
VGSGAEFVEWDRALSVDSTPDVLILAQARRNQFDPIRIGQFRARFPAAPAIHLLSSWGEGEMRSGTPLVGWTRVYWHRWRDEFERVVNDKKAGRETLWSANIDGRGSAIHAAGWPGGRCFRVGVWSRFRGETLMIEQALQRFGHIVQTAPSQDRSTPSIAKPDICVLVGDSVDDWLIASLRRARRICRLGRTIVLLGFPRSDEVKALRPIGGRNMRIISKPFDVGLLQQAIQSSEIVGPPAPVSRR